MRTYTYQYDALNRLTSSKLWDQVNYDRDEYQENLTYDINGNIKSLYRTGKQVPGYTAPEKMDDLEYHYENSENSNRLKTVKDNSRNPSGYPALVTPNDIDYDDNGNMTTQADKGISTIAYNFLNLPYQVVQNGVTTQYLYRADGTKLKKSYGTGKVTDYLDGFQYELENGVAKLQFVPTSEGYYDFVKNLYIYNYVDHLGNTRLSYTKNSAGVLEILEENNYYPFGLKHSGYNNITGANPSYQYKYNGKELQESGMYDYGARFYMPDIGRWGVVDPLAEKSTRFSPYTYAFNNPIRFIDPDGRENEDWVKRGNQIFFDAEITTQQQAVDKYGSNAQHLDEGSTVTSVTNGQADGEFQYTLHDNGTVTDSNGDVMDNTQNIEVRDKTIFSNCQSCLNPGTLYNNLFGLTYPGGNNPQAYNGNYSYEYNPIFKSEFYQIQFIDLFPHFFMKICD